MEPLQLFVVIFVATLLLVFLVVRAVLDRPVLRGPWKQPEPPDILAPDLAALLPALPEARRELQKLLWTAGYYRPSALNEYLAIRAILTLAPLALLGILAYYLPESWLPYIVGGGLILALLGYSLPRVILGVQASARSNRLNRALPLAMDVLALCLTAGQNLVNSLRYTTRELSSSCPEMAVELQIVQQQARMHSLELALLGWAERLSDIPAIRSMALLLVQSDRLGTNMVDTLVEVADSQRTLERQKVEAQANRANFWMLFPTLFCLWTASAIILIGPVYLEFWDYRREQMKSLLNNAVGQVERSTGNNPNAQTNPAAPPGQVTIVPAQPAPAGNP
ncbi:MAG: type II secretion system F family protein [Gemmataceae bacterium]